MKRQYFRSILMIVIAMTFLVSPATTSAIASPGEGLAPPPIASLENSHMNTADPQSSGIERIRFARGTTSAVVSDDLGARRRDRYSLRAFAGQLMDVSLSAPEGAKLSVTTSDGRSLRAITSSATSFRGYLPRSGNYILVVTAGSQPISYSLNVSIPERISFERGTTSAAIEKTLENSQSHDYILRAQAGQLMEINAVPDDPEEGLQLIIYGVDGTVLRSGMGEGSSFRGELPANGDYIVTIRAQEEDVSFTMDVIIPKRISFERGAVSATERGRLRAHRSQYYVLRALEDQTMKVEVTADDDVQLIIYGADGTVLKSGMGEGASFNDELPSTQDYVLVVRSGDDPVAYTLRVTIR